MEFCGKEYDVLDLLNVVLGKYRGAPRRPMVFHSSIEVKGGVSCAEEATTGVSLAVSRAHEMMLLHLARYGLRPEDGEYTLRKFLPVEVEGEVRYVAQLLWQEVK